MVTLHISWLVNSLFNPLLKDYFNKKSQQISQVKFPSTTLSHEIGQQPPTRTQPVSHKVGRALSCHLAKSFIYWVINMSVTESAQSTCTLGAAPHCKLVIHWVTQSTESLI